VQVQEEKNNECFPQDSRPVKFNCFIFSFKRLCQRQSCIGHSLTQESMKPLHENPPKLLRRLMMYCLHSLLRKSLQYWPSQVFTCSNQNETSSMFLSNVKQYYYLVNQLSSPFFKTSVPTNLQTLPPILLHRAERVLKILLGLDMSQETSSELATLQIDNRT